MRSEESTFNPPLEYAIILDGVVLVSQALYCPGCKGTGLAYIDMSKATKEDTLPAPCPNCAYPILEIATYRK